MIAVCIECAKILKTGHLCKKCKKQIDKEGK